jgi:hypothetical protein
VDDKPITCVHPDLGRPIALFTHDHAVAADARADARAVGP